MRSRAHPDVEPVRTRSAAAFVTRMELAAVVVLFSIAGYFLAPFSFGDKRVLVPQEGELDAIQQSLLIAGSIEKLAAEPRSFYDTAILYPDWNQLRTTEPFLGYALPGLLLKALLPNEIDVFEALRWIIVITCLTYGYLLFRAIGIDIGMSAAGALLCLSQPGLLNGIGRMNLVCLPLILPVLYHSGRVLTSGGLRHSVGLFVFAAWYPLCGMINATLCAMASLFILPMLLKLLAARPRRTLAAFLLPLALAAALDVVLLAPWLLDRSDLAAYVSDEFLRIKHWNPMRGPERIENAFAFVMWALGPGVSAALAAPFVFRLIERFRAKGRLRDTPLVAPMPLYLLVLCLVALGVDISASYHSGRLVLPGLRWVFHLLCYATLFLYWRDQLRTTTPSDQASARQYIATLSFGLGVFVCLMSFGPVFVSNTSTLANHITSMLLHLLPPLKAIREFHRIWILGVLLLSVYATVRLSVAVRASSPIMRLGAVGLIAVAAVSSVCSRQLIASSNIEAPSDLFVLASHSRASGAIYVHPHMEWNTTLAVSMIPLTRVLGRPSVNGYLGIAPPWFGYASRVLHRFPDPEAVWLLRKWKVDTVVSLAGDVLREQSTFAEKVFENGRGVVYDVPSVTVPVPHPSAHACATSEEDLRVEVSVSPAEPAGEGSRLTLAVPNGFRAKSVEVSFRQSVVDQLPQSIGIYALDGTQRIRLNLDNAGSWIESLAAEALLHRRSPVATIRVIEWDAREFQLEFQKSARPPLERIALCGVSDQ